MCILYATIYKIYSKDQTINFENRKFSHFHATCWGQSKTKNKLYEFIRSHGGWTNWKTLGGTLNSVNPGSNKNKYKNSPSEILEKSFQ